MKQHITLKPFTVEPPFFPQMGKCAKYCNDGCEYVVMVTSVNVTYFEATIIHVISGDATQGCLVRSVSSQNWSHFYGDITIICRPDDM